MAASRHFKIKEQISQDSVGEVFRAVDHTSGKKVVLRKYTQPEPGSEGLHAVEEVAYQVAVERISTIRHSSLRRVLSGGSDPDDGAPYFATPWIEADPLMSILRETQLSVEVATTLLGQLLELCELLSHVLAEDGVWVETDVASISVAGDAYDTRFIFWAAPLKCINGSNKSKDFDALIQLTQSIMGWEEREVDEREGSHLAAWLNWLKEESTKGQFSIRETREMLAAAAGIEPPPPIIGLVTEAQRRRSWLEKWPSLTFIKFRTPKMPLFVFLSVLFVVEAVAGWLWLRKIDKDIDHELREINLSIHDSPYAPIVGDDSSERGSKPLDFSD